MVALLDVNVLVALFDPAHGHHEAAHRWFGDNRYDGWATCPLTENGLVRVLSNPAYPGRRTTVGDALERLRLFRASGNHVFWTDSVTLCDESLFDTRHLAGHRQLTDVYLLGLAVKNKGRLTTFDGRISPHAVAEAEPANLAIIRD
jgi:hypothetical protein